MSRALTLRPPKDKYRGSAELAAKVVRRYTTEPILELRALLRRIAAAWLIGDGDLHLKNLSLLFFEGRHQLSPAYDAISTRLYIEDDPLALPVRGRDRGLERAHWLSWSEDVGLPRKAAARVLDELAAAGPETLELMDRSPMPADYTSVYRALLEARLASISG